MLFLKVGELWVCLLSHVNGLTLGPSSSETGRKEGKSDSDPKKLHSFDVTRFLKNHDISCGSRRSDSSFL